MQSMRLSQGLTSIPSPPNHLVRLLLSEHIRPAPHSVEMFNHHDSNDDYMPLRVTACPHPLSSQGVIWSLFSEGWTQECQLSVLAKRCVSMLLTQRGGSGDLVLLSVLCLKCEQLELREGTGTGELLAAWCRCLSPTVIIGGVTRDFPYICEQP